ncbi:hypothetical protein HJFPF1_09265 [Paramyrothecium foliicola]|nr:hypothetical protein HJFPF1_09265 [Paramyrothecium foliicola]
MPICFTWHGDAGIVTVQQLIVWTMRSSNTRRGPLSPPAGEEDIAAGFAKHKDEETRFHGLGWADTQRLWACAKAKRAGYGPSASLPGLIIEDLGAYGETTMLGMADPLRTPAPLSFSRAKQA